MSSWDLNDHYYVLTELTEKEYSEKYLYQFDGCQPTQMLCFLKFKLNKEKIDTADNMRPSNNILLSKHKKN